MFVLKLFSGQRQREVGGCILSFQYLFELFNNLGSIDPSGSSNSSSSFSRSLLDWKENGEV